MTSHKNIDIDLVSRREPSIIIENVDPCLTVSNIKGIMKEYGTLQNIQMCENTHNPHVSKSAVIDFNMWNNDYITKTLRINLLAGDSELLIYDYKKGHQLSFRALTPDYQRPVTNFHLDTSDIYDRHHR